MYSFKNMLEAARPKCQQQLSQGSKIMNAFLNLYFLQVIFY